jgi:hypothetical protein
MKGYLLSIENRQFNKDILEAKCYRCELPSVLL